jgi:hypothetical protein
MVPKLDSEYPHIRLSFQVKVAQIGMEVYVGSQINDSFFIRENVMWRVAQFLDAVYGRVVKGNKFPDRDELVGKEVVVAIVVDTSGYRQYKVSGYYPVAKWDKLKGMPAPVPYNGGGGNAKKKSSIDEISPQPIEKDDDDEDIPF